MPKVSVIVPTFNRAAFVVDAIESVLSQGYRDFELIVVDDGSTDETEARVKAIVDPRLIYFAQRNRGRSHARNRALAAAGGEYVAFLDSDDLYLPHKLATQVAYLDSHPEVGMIYTSANCIDEAGEPLPERYTASRSGRIYEDIAFFRPVTITLPTVMVRRSLMAEVGGFEENMSRLEDTDMWRRLSKVTVIHALDVETCQLRTHPENSLSTQDPMAIVSSIDYYAAKVSREDSELSPWEMRHRLGGLYLYYGKAFLTIAGWGEMARGMLIRACRYWPPYFAVSAAVLFRRWIIGHFDISHVLSSDRKP